MPSAPQRRSQRASLSSTTAAGRVSKICSRSPTCSTPNGGCTSSDPRSAPAAGAPGYHWYSVPRVGFPDPDTFWAAHAALASFHDGSWARTGITSEQTVLGGFSMGTVMSYALGPTRERPIPAGLLAFSGFIPTVPDWQPSLTDRRAVRAFIAHGRLDNVISVDFGRAARDLLSDCGLEVVYREHGGGHEIDPDHLAAATAWLAETL